MKRVLLAALFAVLPAGLWSQQSALVPGAVRFSDATPENPYINGLGMKFAHVENGDQPFLISILAVQLQEYAVFAKATKVPNEEWKTREFGYVDRITWHEAVAFCEWLTRTERSARRINKAQAYRLPTDAQWTAGEIVFDNEVRSTWEWCAELKDTADESLRIIRGSSGRRGGGAHRGRYQNTAFRVVLSDSAGQGANSAVPMAPMEPASAPAASAPPANTPAPIAYDASLPVIEILSQQSPNASSWVYAPLNELLPPNIRQNLTSLREDLLDEGKKTPKANLDAYRFGYQLCNSMISALDERDKALARAGFTVAQANAKVSTSNQQLDARRNYMQSWPQYVRETNLREEIKNQSKNNTLVVQERSKLDWSERAASLRKTFETQYSQFRQALRQ